VVDDRGYGRRRRGGSRRRVPDGPDRGAPQPAQAQRDGARGRARARCHRGGGCDPGHPRRVAFRVRKAYGSRMLEDLSVKIFADGADLDGILALADDPRISGFTTNPTLMWKAGLTDYGAFAQRLLERIMKHPISFEVFADSAEEVRRQARLIASWGENVYVKIPVTL